MDKRSAVGTVALDKERRSRRLRYIFALAAVFIAAPLVVYALLYYRELGLSLYLGGGALFFILLAFAFLKKDQLFFGEDQYRLFLESIPITTYMTEPTIEDHILYMSPQVEKMIGYSPRDFTRDQMLWRKIIHADDRDGVLALNLKTAKSGEPFFMEYRMIARNGSVVWVRDEAMQALDDKGIPLYWLGAWTDITREKKSEKEMAYLIQIQSMRNNQLKTAGEVSRAVTSVLDLNELMPKIVEVIRSHFNYYYVGLFLVDKENDLAILRAASGEAGKKILAMNQTLPIGDSSMIGWCIAHNQARIALDVETDAIRFNNPELPLTRSEVALPLRFRGRVVGGMTIQSEESAAFSAEDVTALQMMGDQVANAIETARLFEERAELIRELETKNAELERYTYTVSHDLKSPLVTIRGYLGYLRKSVANGDVGRFEEDVNRINQAAETMQALLNDLLELSRVGRVVNLSENAPFNDVVNDALNLVVKPHQRAWIKIQSGLSPVYCDRARIAEAIQNLVSNALKFLGDQLDPLIDIGQNGFDENTGYPIFYVADNGIGIEPKYHETVFGLFNRLNQQVEGTGIGLTLVKRIIEFHGGRIWLESAGAGKGTTFYFTLPLAKG